MNSKCLFRNPYYRRRSFANYWIASWPSWWATRNSARKTERVFYCPTVSIETVNGMSARTKTSSSWTWRGGWPKWQWPRPTNKISNVGNGLSPNDRWYRKKTITANNPLRVSSRSFNSFTAGCSAANLQFSIWFWRDARQPPLLAPPLLAPPPQPRQSLHRLQ